jgi:hypothetical protein
VLQPLRITLAKRVSSPQARDLSMVDITHCSEAAALNVGLLLARLILGLSTAAHGAQKLFGWFGVALVARGHPAHASQAS